MHKSNRGTHLLLKPMMDSIPLQVKGSLYNGPPGPSQSGRPQTLWTHALPPSPAHSAPATVDFLLSSDQVRHAPDTGAFTLTIYDAQTARLTPFPSCNLCSNVFSHYSQSRSQHRPFQGPLPLNSPVCPYAALCSLVCIKCFIFYF